MVRKNNIRSIRFSDALAEQIDRQVGDTFTAKFENLVTRCVWELPQKEKELAQLDQDIKRKQKQLEQMNGRIATIAKTLQNLEPKLHDLETAIGKEVRSWQSRL